MDHLEKPVRTPVIDCVVWEQPLQLETDSQLFAPQAADPGTLAMINQVRLQPADRLLDLGCGYGLVGLAAAKVLGPQQVVLVDINPLAVQLARRNAARNGLAGLRVIEGDGPAAVAPEQFSLILCNPPYHTDFSVARRLIEQSYACMSEGARFYLVVKRLIWYQKKMTAVFGGVQVRESNGYYVLCSEKRPRSAVPANPAGLTEPAKPTTRKHQKKLADAARRKKRG
jgi:16S rRNA (guanine1207-N2)-methyltransferase